MRVFPVQTRLYLGHPLPTLVEKKISGYLYYSRSLGNLPHICIVVIRKLSERNINHYLFRQNTYLQNKKHTLTCQGGDWLLQILITNPIVSWRGWETPPPSTAAQLSFFAQPRLGEDLSLRGGLPSSSATDHCLRFWWMDWTSFDLSI